MADMHRSLDRAIERTRAGEGHSAESGLLIPSHWNPHWNYHLGGEPRSICACPDGPYYGAALVGTPPYCERCGGLTHVTPPGVGDAR